MANDNPQVNEQIPRTKSQKNDFLIFFQKTNEKSTTVKDQIYLLDNEKKKT